MNNPQKSNQNLFSRIKNIVSGDSRKYGITLLISLLLFFVLAIVDTIISSIQGVNIGTILIPLMSITFIISHISVHLYGKYYTIPKIAFASTAIILGFLYFSIGKLNGCYFYFFPAILIYFSQTTTAKDNSRLNYFYLITFFFIAITGVP